MITMKNLEISLKTLKKILKYRLINLNTDITS